jgi:hypothetical protein
MAKSEMLKTLELAYEHIEEDDPQPSQVLLTPGHVTMSMASIDELLEWTDLIEGSGTDTRVTFVAQLLWKQAEDQDAPSVVTAQYDWESDVNGEDYTVTVRVVASSPLTMDQLTDVTIDDRIGVTRSDVENLMIQGHARKAGLTFEPL